jgi:hypothetical protein
MLYTTRRNTFIFCELGVRNEWKNNLVIVSTDDRSDAQHFTLLTGCVLAMCCVVLSRKPTELSCHVCTLSIHANSPYHRRRSIIALSRTPSFAFKKHTLDKVRLEISEVGLAVAVICVRCVRGQNSAAHTTSRTSWRSRTGGDIEKMTMHRSYSTRTLLATPKSRKCPDA